jgi:hypothetical protein
MEKLLAPETKKFKAIELPKNSSSEEILQFVETYISEVNELIPPFEGDFNSEEIFKTIKTNPDRKKAIEEFKQKLQSQTEGMACCRTLIEKVIIQNPKVEVGVLMEILNKFASKYGVSGKQLQTYIESIYAFGNKREVVTEIRKDYPNDLDLINSMVEPKDMFVSMEGIKIEDSPFGFILYLNTNNAKKFHLNAAYAGGFSVEVVARLKRKDKDGNDMAAVTRIAVIVTDSDYIKNGKISADQLTLHEVEHNKTDVVKDLLFQDSSTYKQYVTDYLVGRSGIWDHLRSIKFYEEQFNEFIERTPDGQNKETLIAKKKEELDQEVKDHKERIKKLENKTYLVYRKYLQRINYKNYQFLVSELISRKKDRVSHDFKKVIENYSNFTESDEFFNIILPDIEYSPQFKERLINLKSSMQEQYFQDAEKAINSFDKLISKGGYSVDEAISLLSFTPLQLWSKKINRILGTK